MKLKSPETSLLKPVLLSLMLHAGLIVGIILSYKPDNAPVTEEVIQSISIILVERKSQEVLRIDAESVEVIKEDTTGAVENIVFLSDAEILPLSPKITIFDQTVVSEQSGLPNQPAVNETTGEDSSLQFQEVASAISRYMSTYTRSLSQDWLSECIKYQNRHGTNDCPQGLSDKDIRPVYRDFDGNQKEKYVARIDFLNSAMSDNALSDDGKNALNMIKQNYLSIVSPEEKWTPQMAGDKFNPNLGGPTLSLFGVGSGSPGITKLFGQGNSITNLKIIEEPEKAPEEDTAVNSFDSKTPLFPLR